MNILKESGIFFQIKLLNDFRKDINLNEIKNLGEGVESSLKAFDMSLINLKCE